MICDQVLSGLDLSFLEEIDPEILPTILEFKLPPQEMRANLSFSSVSKCTGEPRKSSTAPRQGAILALEPISSAHLQCLLRKGGNQGQCIRSLLLPAISDLRISHVGGCIQISMFHLSFMGLSRVHPYLPPTFLQWVLLAPQLVAEPHPSSSHTTFPLLK